MNFWRKGVGLQWMFFMPRSVKLRALPYAAKRRPAQRLRSNKIGRANRPPASALRSGAAVPERVVSAGVPVGRT